MPLTKEQILSASDSKPLEVQVPEWGDSVFIRVMSVGERDAFELEYIRSGGKHVDNFRTKYLQSCLCNERGELLFTKDDIAALSQRNGAVMHRLWEKAMSHNGMTQKDADQIAGE